MAARIKLGELLVRAGVLDEFKLKAALAEQQRWGGRLGKILVEMNFLTEDLLVRALSKQLGIPRARFEPGSSIPTDILSKIDPTFCSNNAICPERYIPDRKVLVVAMADPTNVSAIDELRFKTGLRIETSLAGELEVNQAIDRRMYGREPVEGLELSESDSLSTQPLSAQAFDHNLPFDGQNVGPPSMPIHSRPTPMPSSPQPTNSQLGFSTQMGPLGQPTPPPAGPGRSPAYEMAVALDAAQKKQLKAIRAMLELLIEKGVISRDEYLQLVNRR